jgi:hypothetical protein
MVAHSDQMRGKQQGLGTELSPTKNHSPIAPVRGHHDITLIGGVPTTVNPPRMDDFHEPRSLNLAPHRDCPGE